MSIMLFHNRIDCRKPQAAPFLLGGKIWVKHLAKMFLSNATSLVFNHYLYISAILQEEIVVLAQCNIFTPPLNSPAFQLCLVSINNNIAYSLAYLAFICFNRPEII